MIWSKYKQVALHLALIVALYSITRLFFLIFNFGYFTPSTKLIAAFFYGLRFDAVAISWTNGFLFAALLLPFPFVQNKIFITLYRILFIGINACALLLNSIDIGYFEFTQKRSTFDLFQTLSGANDGIQSLPSYIRDYWYILFLWLAILIILIKYSKIPLEKPQKYSLKSILSLLAVLVFIYTPLLVIAIRGGLQYRPISMISATSYLQGKEAALVLNTPFCIIKSISKPALNPVRYFSKKDALSIYSPFHQETDSVAFTPKNVVLIIMESFSMEYTGFAAHEKTLTPFLDSLSEHSTYFTRAYANGKTSIKGIPSILASLPTLFDGSFIYSPYNANSFESIATALTQKGYSSSFYHGGHNGTMGFDAFVKAAGFEKYYGKNEYPNNNDYDGDWGIFDEPFFQFFKQGLDQQKKPFVSCFFSLSSHHPYRLPEKYQDKFKGNTLAISSSIQYADYALSKFFESAKKSSWFANTLFVITADHTSMSNKAAFQTDAGIYHVPLLIFDPQKNKKEEQTKIVQQIDIMPSILGLLHYDLPYFAFGHDVNSSTQQGFSISYNGQFYQLITSKYCVQFNDNKIIAVYDLNQDAMLQNNLYPLSNSTLSEAENLLKAFIQVYNQSLLENKMTYSKN